MNPVSAKLGFKEVWAADYAYESACFLKGVLPEAMFPADPEISPCLNKEERDGARAFLENLLNDHLRAVALVSGYENSGLMADSSSRSAAV